MDALSPNFHTLAGVALYLGVGMAEGADAVQWQDAIGEFTALRGNCLLY